MGFAIALYLERWNPWKRSGVKLSLKLVSIGCGITRRNDMNHITDQGEMLRFKKGNQQPKWRCTEASNELSIFVGLVLKCFSTKPPEVEFQGSGETVGSPPLGPPWFQEVRDGGCSTVALRRGRESTVASRAEVPGGPEVLAEGRNAGCELKLFCRSWYGFKFQRFS